jgi:hypothetical protein
VVAAALPRRPELDASLYRPLAEEVDTFTAAGFTASPGLRIVIDPSSGTKAQRLAQLERRPYSIFEHMSARQLDIGFASLRREVDTDPHGTVSDVRATLLAMTRQPNL